ncbi:hypothetical protein H7C18_26525 [Cohnella sp. CBP 2801]|uniref:Uncharacterized protein n=1 Tax=Cohnella zeiphila TaxID=2761120 RepID=A0A7X0SQX0_9BACL|nr:hypothetical protein [Cohnella zeiphila]
MPGFFLPSIAAHGPYTSSSPIVVAVPPPLAGATFTRTWRVLTVLGRLSATVSCQNRHRFNPAAVCRRLQDDLITSRETAGRGIAYGLFFCARRQFVHK